MDISMDITLAHLLIQLNTYMLGLCLIFACLPFLLFILSFLRAKAALLSARLSHCNSVRPSVCLSVHLSVTRVDQAKTVQARITKSSPSAARKTLVSGTVKLFHKFEGGHPDRGP